MTPACPACQTTLDDPSALYCSRCGASLKSPAGRPTPVKGRWYHNIWFVIFMLLFVLGPFGLPLAWSNPRFPRWVKWLLTLGMAAYTIAMIKVTVQMVHAVSQAVQQFNLSISP